MPEASASTAARPSADPDTRLRDHDERPVWREWRPRAFGIDLPPYKPRPWLFSGKLQTIGVPVLGHRPLEKQFPSQRLTVPFDDGSGDRTDVYHYWPGRPQRFRSDGPRPRFLLLHGLGGHAHSAYIECSAAALLEAGYEVLLPNFRGAGSARDLAAILHHPGRSDDLHLLLTSMQRHRPDLFDRDLIAVGYSLGGHLLLKFLADHDVGHTDGDRLHPRLKLAVTVSAPLSLASTSERLTEWQNSPFNLYLLRKIKHDVLRPNASLSASEREAIAAARTVWQLDDTFTAPRLGEESAEAFYAAHSAIDELEEITLPTVMIHSLDDPFVPNADYSHPHIEANRHLAPVLLPDGGHVGFFTGQSGPRWLDRTLLRLAEELPIDLSR